MKRKQINPYFSSSKTRYSFTLQVILDTIFLNYSSRIEVEIIWRHTLVLLREKVLMLTAVKQFSQPHFKMQPPFKDN